MAHPDNQSRNTVPVTIVTGFLGAGKTTLINRALSESDVGQIVVIVNEFGKIGVDGSLIDAGAEDLIELANGCICCVVRGDLIRAMRGLLADCAAPRGIVIEMSGLAMPGQVISSLMLDQVLARRCHLASVVAVVDASRFPRLCEDWDQPVEQVMYSDIVVLTRTDRDDHVRVCLADEIRGINPTVEILVASQQDFSAAKFLDRYYFLSRNHPLPPDSHATHLKGASSLSLTSDLPLDGEVFVPWLTDYLSRKDQSILRTKGIVRFHGNIGAFVVQGVDKTLNIEWKSDDRFPHEASRLDLIGRGLEEDALRAGFENCLTSRSEVGRDLCPLL